MQRANLELWQQAKDLHTAAACLVLLQALQGALHCAQLPCLLLLLAQSSILLPFADFLVEPTTLQWHAWLVTLSR